MILRLCTYCLVLLLLSSPAYAASGRLSGAATLSYAQLTAEEDGVEVLDASHFVQKYSLLWEKSGEIENGRAGDYDIALGYEWSWIESDVNGAEVDFENPLDKILFRGDLLLAPGGLPFRLHIYSEDMQSTSFVGGLYGDLFEQDDLGRDFGIVSSFNNGSHITTGMTLIAGVNNGDYRGQYRNLFKAMPKLLIDFRQDEVRDRKSPMPIDYVDRNLAFVSLNKNKNWFHYRFSTHEDKIDSSNDFETQTFLLGTIDHVDRRQWIDLTNWIKISTDLAYSETTPDMDSNEQQEKRYDYNLFVAADRTSWNGSVYTGYSRSRDELTLDKQLNVPIFANGHLNRDTTWRIRFENQHQEEDLIASDVTQKQSNLFLSSRLDMFSQSRYMVSPKLEMEHKDSWVHDGSALRGGVEIYSNPRHRSDLDLFGEYLLAGYQGDETSYYEHQLQGRIAKDLTSTSRYELGQKLIYGSGKYNNQAFDFMAADVSALTISPGDSGEYYRSISNFAIDHRPANRIYNRLAMTYDYIDSIVGKDGELTVVHNIDYYGGDLRAAMTNELIWGGSVHDSFKNNLDLSNESTIVREGGVEEVSFESIARLDYSPDRRHHHSLDFELDWRKFEDGESDRRYQFTQLYEYTFWKESGLIRKIAVLGEEFEYEDYADSLGESRSLLTFTLFSDLYPTRHTLLSARLRYAIDTTEESDTMLAFLSAGVDFSKFQLELNYAYGTRTAGISQPERVEHKWEMKVTKTF